MRAIKRRRAVWQYLYFVMLAASCLAPASVHLQAEQNPAVSSLEGAMNDLPLDSTTRQEIQAAIKSHNYASAEAVLVKAADQHPKVPQIYDYLGRIFFVDGKYLNAAIALKKSEALQPLEEKDRFTLAMAYISLQHPAWARPELEELAEANPRNPLYKYWQGRLEYDGQNVPAAIAKFKNAIAMDPGFMKAYDNLGLCLEALGKNDAAIEQYQNAVRLNRDNNLRSPWPPMNLGALLTKLDRLEEAEPLFRESLQFDADFAQSHYQLGALLQKQNKIPAAVEELKRAAALDPAYSDPHYALARLYRRAGKMDQAQHELQIFQDLKAKEPIPRLESRERLP